MRSKDESTPGGSEPSKSARAASTEQPRFSPRMSTARPRSPRPHSPSGQPPGAGHTGQDTEPLQEETAAWFANLRGGTGEPKSEDPMIFGSGFKTKRRTSMPAASPPPRSIPTQPQGQARATFQPPD